MDVRKEGKGGNHDWTWDVWSLLQCYSSIWMALDASPPGGLLIGRAATGCLSSGTLGHSTPWSRRILATSLLTHKPK